MSTINISKNDEIIMKLTHYLVTKENYTPIVVNGVKDEIWLENSDGPYRIIRINSNYIHNNEQLNYDILKTKNVMQQIKKKTLSFSINTLNIFLNLNDDVRLNNSKNIDLLSIKNIKDLKKKNKLNEVFPNMNSELIDTNNDVELLFNVTNDINKKTQKENEKYEKVFSTKKPLVTNILIGINVFIFLLMYIFGNGSYDVSTLIKFGASYTPLIKSGEIYRLFTCMFLHIGVLHLIMNMYSLKIIGSQLESFIGKKKYIIVYLVSGIFGSLFASIFETSYISAGASGAIFGLLGSMLYFGYHYRLYLGSVLKQQIVPIILLNLGLSYFISGISFYAHLGGLIGGLLISIVVGITDKTDKQERINGLISFVLVTALLIYMLFFR